MQIGGGPFLAIPILVLVALLALAAIAFVSVSLLKQLSTQMSGLTTLARLYPADDRPEGQEYVRQTVQIGAIRYRRCVTVCVNPQGLYLWVQPRLVQVRPIFIPWREVKRTQGARLYGRAAVRLVINGLKATTIVVYENLFQVVSPYLAPDLGNTL